MIKFIKKVKNKIDDNKFLRFIITAIKTVLWIILLAILIVILVQKFTSNKLSIKGYRVFSVASSSMVPEYEIGDIIISKSADVKNIKVGDNITYLGNKGDFDHLVITHKVVSKRAEGGKNYFTTKGIANDLSDPEIEYSQIYGKVIYKTVVLSYISHIMNNIIAYYILFGVVGIYVSLQIVKIVYDIKNVDDDEEDDYGSRTEKED